MSALGDYLQEASLRRREAGVWDCATFPAGWVMWNGLPDPMAAWRGQYRAEFEPDDLAGLFSEALAGFEVVAEPIEGDIGVVQIFGAQAGAIYTGKRWAVVAQRGLGFVSLGPNDPVKVWRLPNG